MPICSICGIVVGRAKRNNEELIKALQDKTFSTSIEVWKYDKKPFTSTYYCTKCWKERKNQ